MHTYRNVLHLVVSAMEGDEGRDLSGATGRMFGSESSQVGKRTHRLQFLLKDCAETVMQNTPSHVLGLFFQFILHTLFFFLLKQRRNPLSTVFLLFFFSTSPGMPNPLL